MVKLSKLLLIVALISLVIGIGKGFLLYPFVSIPFFTPKTYLFFSNTAIFFAIALLLLQLVEKKQ
ncbi:MAG: hypothetical protein A2149_05155 [Candidatus Schekmanbacteria bacterium RBG_16_38_11]|uniref:Uncharacterized protein n=2 Tax=Candidatus Schekmaniibacteriota TaxID=1817811 RepID=A0A1F7RM60_9BACT|nr:MAG: hypothetical protein A2042_09490 [Candidatus Schekmanbacteria bacterium GWA2_38_11]OGL43902.1 MAG: hypothetical protein A2149_05155 [Candidatus Schekmanbacteria bacterium RBG_16_38_11]